MLPSNQPHTRTEIDTSNAPQKTTGLSLCNDLVFKALFSRHPHLLADLINAVRHHAPPIQVKQILNPNILPQDLTSKDIILDILVEDTEGMRFGIEMQLGRFYHWAQRNVYGIARSLAGQLEAGQDYRHLKPVIGISLMVHDLFSEYPDKADWHFTLRDTHDPSVQLGEVLQMHIIELSKAETLGSLLGPLSAWNTCLLHNQDEVIMNEITYPPVREALSHLDVMYSDEELRLAAERREQALVDAEDMLYLARHEGMQKGKIEGKIEGKQEGQANLLQRLLTRKFGTLPAEIQQRIQTATLAQLDAWSLNILDATDLDSVFTN